jgi:hypothetical protein
MWIIGKYVDKSAYNDVDPERLLSYSFSRIFIQGLGACYLIVFTIG